MDQRQLDQLRSGVDYELRELLGDASSEEEVIHVAPKTTPTIAKSNLDDVDLELRYILGADVSSEDTVVADDSFSPLLKQDNTQSSLEMNEFFKAGLDELSFAPPRPRPFPVPSGMPSPSGQPTGQPYPIPGSVPTRIQPPPTRPTRQARERLASLIQDFKRTRAFKEAMDSSTDAIESMLKHEIGEQAATAFRQEVTRQAAQVC